MATAEHGILSLPDELLVEIVCLSAREDIVRALLSFKRLYRVSIRLVFANPQITRLRRLRSFLRTVSDAHDLGSLVTSLDILPNVTRHFQDWRLFHAAMANMDNLAALSIGRFQAPAGSLGYSFGIQSLRSGSCSLEVLEYVVQMGSLQRLSLGSLELCGPWTCRHQFAYLSIISAPYDILLAIIQQCPALERVQMTTPASSSKILHYLLPCMQHRQHEISEVFLFLEGFVDISRHIQEMAIALPRLQSLTLYTASRITVSLRSVEVENH